MTYATNDDDQPVPTTGRMARPIRAARSLGVIAAGAVTPVALAPAVEAAQAADRDPDVWDCSTLVEWSGSRAGGHARPGRSSDRDEHAGRRGRCDRCALTPHVAGATPPPRAVGAQSSTVARHSGAHRSSESGVPGASSMQSV